ncbi:MAG: DUF2852 domain-containing protein [Acetobacteraceae bacterium]
MASYANQGSYGNPAWGAVPPSGTQQQQQWGGGPWTPPGWAGRGGCGGFSVGKAGSIVLLILGFMLWWPVGLAILFYMFWSGRMGFMGRGRRHNDGGAGWQGSEAPWNAWRNWCGSGPASRSSGNRAFDEYRAETLRRLEEEQQEFGAFLDRLRVAKDKAEFDQFMADRRQRPQQPPTEDKPPTA